MENLFISIIIPVYNTESFLERCVSSVLKQSFDNFEILLINDGSTDSSLEICKRLGSLDSRVKVFTHDNQGVSYTRNKGISLAKGDWLYFLDSDDFIEKEVFLDFKNSLTENTELMYYGMNRRTKEGTIYRTFISEQDFVFKKASDFYLNNNINIMNIVLCFYNREQVIKNKILFNEKVRYGEDLAFSMKCFSISRDIKVRSKVIYNYVDNHGSAMFQDVSFSSVKDHLILAEDLVEFKMNTNVDQDFLDLCIEYMVKSFFSRSILLEEENKWNKLNRVYKEFYKLMSDKLILNRLMLRVSMFDIRVYCFLMKVKQLIR